MTEIRGNNEFKCDRGSCEKLFVAENILIRHFKLHDNDVESCFFCPYKTAGKDDVIPNHLNVHFQIRPYKCTFCDVKYFKNRELTDHEEANHEKISDRYKCETCQFRTYSRKLLHRHKQISH